MITDKERREGDRVAAELEARQDACDQRTHDLMQDHHRFAKFVTDSVGEEWMTNVIAAMAKTSSPMGDAYREYCEME